MRELSQLVSKPVIGPNHNGHVVDRYLDVARAMGCEVTEPVDFPLYITSQEAAAAEAIAAQAGLRPDNRYVVLAPGTNWPTKCWPVQHFAKLSDKLHQNTLIPVLIGGKGDKRLAEEIAALTTIPPVDLTGKTSLKQLAHIIKQAACFVGGDTGPMHLAVAVNTPVVALFGATDPERNGPYGLRNQVVQVDRTCRGCWCPKDEVCLETIAPEVVYQSVISSMLI